MNGSYYMLDGEVIRHHVNLTAETWHAKLGCLNADSMRDLGAMVDGYAVPSNLNITCDICTEAKSTRGHFTESTNPRANILLTLSIWTLWSSTLLLPEEGNAVPWF